MVEGLQSQVSNLNEDINQLSSELAESKSHRADLEGDLSLTKGRMREMEAAMLAMGSSGYDTKASLKIGTESNDGGKISSGDISTNTSNHPTGKSSLDRDEDDGISKKTPLGEELQVTSEDIASIFYGGDDTPPPKSDDNPADAKQDLKSTSSSSKDKVSLGKVAASEDQNKSNQLDQSTLGSSNISRASKGFAGLKSDNLQIIEGVGAKMESVLKEHGYDSWESIAIANTAQLQAMLDTYGDKYRIIDPGSWVAQARYASKGEWDKLVDLQKNLDGGKPGVGSSAAKVEKMLYKLGLKPKYVQDDLKVVEGIGPKIANLLISNGIDTWSKLAKTTVVDLQKILDSAGSSMQLADPGTWPAQAEMADKGAWDQLEEYQDFLQGGKQ